MAHRETASVIAVDSVRKLHTIIYSNAETDAFNGHSFAHAAVVAFKENTTSKVLQWACCMECHKEGGFHFHMCILLNRIQRWLKAQNAIKDRHSIVVNFSGHSGYHTAYEYVTQKDSNCLNSLNSSHHPENVIARKTLKATKKNARRGQGG